MDGDSGFCASILGTFDFAEGASKIKNLYSQNSCHTLDRGDYRTMRESCCLAKDNEWDDAASWNFKINNWPYVNAESDSVRDCFYTMDKMSPQNLSKDAAERLISTVALALTLAVTLIY